VFAPVTFLLGFFGANVSQAHSGDSMFNVEFWWVYCVAAGLALLPLLVVFVVLGLHRRDRAATPPRLASQPGAGNGS
jgi:hypothetical protein